MYVACTILVTRRKIRRLLADTKILFSYNVNRANTTDRPDLMPENRLKTRIIDLSISSYLAKIYVKRKEIIVDETAVSEA